MKIIIKGVYETHEVFIDDKQLSPAKSQKIINHSPDGFAWGYGGSGNDIQKTISAMIDDFEDKNTDDGDLFIKFDISIKQGA